MYLTYNERKSFVAERFIRTLKNKIYKYMISIIRKCVFNKLDAINKKHNHKYHSTIKMKPVNINTGIYLF